MSGHGSEEWDYLPKFPGDLEGQEDLVRYLFDELTRVAGAMLMRAEGLEVLHAAPPKPRTGMLVFADGSDWDPGSGEGVYVRLAGGTWSKL